MSEPRDLEAHHKIDSHEKVCAERYGNLWEAIKELKASISAARSERAASDAAVHARFNTISNRMWWALASVTGLSFCAFGTLGFYLLTKGKF